MKVQLVNDKTNAPDGMVDIPQQVLDAVALVRAWMQTGGIIELNGLRLLDSRKPQESTRRQ